MKKNYKYFHLVQLSAPQAFLAASQTRIANDIRACLEMADIKA